MTPLISKKISGGYTPGPQLKGGGKGGPPIHIPGYSTTHKE